MLRTLTARSRLLGSSQLQQLVYSLGLNALIGDSALQARATCQPAAGCRQQSSSSSTNSQWPQQHWRSMPPVIQQCVQPAAPPADTRRASFSTSSPSPQKQRKQQQQEQDQQQQNSLQARQAQSKIIQFEYKSATLTMSLPDHTTFPLPLLQAGVLPNPIKTAKHLWHMIRNKAYVWVTLAKARQNIPGYSELGDGMLQQQFASMYVRINEAQASFTLDSIKDLVSRDMFLKLRAQAEQRRMGHWDKIVWQIENEDELHDPKTKSLKLVEGTLVKLTKDSPFEWLRLTYCIRSKQRFAAYKVQRGKRDELVAGNPDEVIDVEDYWMFEHKTRTPVNKEKMPVEGARWRLIKRQTRAVPQ